MKHHLHYGHCLVGVGLAVALLLALGVSTSTLGFLAVAAACPLMMFVMMRTMMGDRHTAEAPERPAGQDQHT
jgi:hypothetical protein